MIATDRADIGLKKWLRFDFEVPFWRLTKYLMSYLSPTLTTQVGNQKY